MKNAEYQGNLSCPQRDSAEHEGYVGAQSVGGQEGKEQDGADLLERILSRGNLNNAYKRVRANKGAPGIDGMTVEDALPWLREHREELLDMMRQGKYKRVASSSRMVSSSSPYRLKKKNWRFRRLNKVSLS